MKTIKVGKRKRNWLMVQPETLMLTSTRCIYLGKEYSFEPVTKAEVGRWITRVRKLLKTEDKPWWQRLFHIKL